MSANRKGKKGSKGHADRRCFVCRAILVGGGKRCGRCRMVDYCSVDCQREHWKAGGHKSECADIAAARSLGTGNSRNSDGAVSKATGHESDDGLRCWVCLEEGIREFDDGGLIVQGCACRELGTVHLDCLFRSAKAYMQRMLESTPSTSSADVAKACRQFKECPTCRLDFSAPIALRMARLTKECCAKATRMLDPITSFYLVLWSESHLIKCFQSLALASDGFHGDLFDERVAEIRTSLARLQALQALPGGGQWVPSDRAMQLIVMEREFQIIQTVYENELYIDDEPDLGRWEPGMLLKCRDLLQRQEALLGRRTLPVADTILLLAIMEYNTRAHRGDNAGSEEAAADALARDARVIAMEALYCEGIDIYSQLFGYYSEITIHEIINCAEVCTFAGLPTQRDAHHRDALARMRMGWGEDDPDTLQFEESIPSTRVPAALRKSRLADAVPMREADYEDTRRNHGPDRPETREAAGKYIEALVEAGEFSMAATVALVKLHSDRKAFEDEIKDDDDDGHFDRKLVELFGKAGIARPIFGLIKTGKMDEAQHAVCAALLVAEPVMLSAMALLDEDTWQSCHRVVDTITSFARFVAAFAHFGLHDASESERLYRLCTDPRATVAASSSSWQFCMWQSEHDDLPDFIEGGLAVVLYRQRRAHPGKVGEAVQRFRNIQTKHRKCWVPHMWSSALTPENMAEFADSMLWFNSEEYAGLATLALTELVQELQQLDVAVTTTLRQLVGADPI